MIRNLYSLKDTKSEFNLPFPDVNDFTAIRHTQNALKDKNEFSMNPEDFQLYKIGSFNTENGELIPECKHIIDVAELLTKAE